MCLFCWEVGKYGIIVNCVVLGFIKIVMIDFIFEEIIVGVV